MERDYSKALKAAQSGAARQIENLSSQLGEDARDAQERRFMVSKRHQDHIVKGKGKKGDKGKAKGGGTKKPQKKGDQGLLINPHTGKKDAKWTAKHRGK